MYKDLKTHYLWYGIKRDIAEYVSLCDTYKRVKAEHQRPVGLLQPLKIPEWKWEEIEMDFIVRLPRTQAGYDSIWVIVDRLTKVAHFIPVKTTYSGAKLVELYVSNSMPTWSTEKDCVRQGLAIHIQILGETSRITDGQTERTNQILEDMLRACVLKYGKSWDKSLPYAKFSYNNSYQASIEMAPYEALYGR
jgi:hypothetical protein